VKDPVNVPPVTVQDCEATELPDKLQEVSFRKKPDPDTVTIVPAWAEAGLNVMDALLTRKVVEATSSSGLPVAVIVYVPGMIEATLNDADKVPLEIEQLNVPIGLPDNEQLVSASEKSDPATSTDAPICAEAGLNVIEGEGSVKLADAESPV